MKLSAPKLSSARTLPPAYLTNCILLLVLTLDRVTGSVEKYEKVLERFSGEDASPLVRLINRRGPFKTSSLTVDRDMVSNDRKNFTELEPHYFHLNPNDTFITSEIPTTEKELLISAQLVIRLAQCRANCLDKFAQGESLASLSLKLESRNSSSIHDCWLTCQFLEEEGRIEFTRSGDHQRITLMCTLNSQLCLPGCQEACGFHHHQPQLPKSSLYPKNSRKVPMASSSHFPPVIAIPVEPFLSIFRLNESLSLIRWPSQSGASNDSSNHHLVYSLVHPHPSFSSWKVLGEQTILNQMTVPSVPFPSELRLLAVSSHGLARVLSIPSERQHNGKKEEDPWHLRLNSLVHQKFLVVTEVRWDFPTELNQVSTRLGNGHHPKWAKGSKSEELKEAESRASLDDNSNGDKKSILGDEAQDDKGEKLNFLLTWEVYGGLVRGHLVTEMNMVTISLWPDTNYILQVGLIDEKQLSLEDGDSTLAQLESILYHGHELPVTFKSRPLSVNTSTATYPHAQKPILAEWKRSADDEFMSRQIRPAHLWERIGRDSTKANHFCSWNVQHHPAPSKDEFRTCVLIWGILIVCLLIIFLMFLYFSLAVYLTMRKQLYFKKLHSTCSVSSIYSRQFYRFSRSLFRRNRPRLNQSTWNRSMELLRFSEDSSDNSGSDDEESHQIEDQVEA